MERVGALITKLQEQYLQHADISTIKLTTQMLLAELQLQESPEQNAVRKVAVMMPSVHASAWQADPEPENVPVVQPVQPEIAPEKKLQEASPGPVPEIKKEIHYEEEPVKEKTVPAKQKKEQSGWLFDPVWEVPTLAHQKREMNDLNQTAEESLNEKLRVEKIELGSVLQETPIRDLKKAIGVNDRYLFINELFRGDETMYERSMKTINSFNILPEAEFWIQRELKLKIGWDEKSNVVHYFDQLIRRRFLST